MSSELPKEKLIHSKVLPEERETLIRYDQKNPEAYVFTYSKKLKTHLMKLGASVLYDNGKGGVEFLILKSWIRDPLPPRNRRVGK